MRNYERRLAREHDAIVRLADDPDRLEALSTPLRAASGAVAGQPLVRGRRGVSSRLRRSCARAWLASPLDHRARRSARCGVVRLPLRGDRLVLPGWARSGLDLGAARSRPHHPHRSGGNRGRDRGVQVPPRRALQVPFATSDPGVETIAAPRGVMGLGRAGRAVGAGALIGLGVARGARHALALDAGRWIPEPVRGADGIGKRSHAAAAEVGLE